jgi:hypothetical protein
MAFLAENNGVGMSRLIKQFLVLDDDGDLPHTQCAARMRRSLV